MPRIENQQAAKGAGLSSMVRLRELRRRYPNEWIAVQLGPGGNRFRPDWGYLLAHGPGRRVIWREVMQVDSGQEACVFYNAPDGPRRESTLLSYRCRWRMLERYEKGRVAD